MGTIEQMSHMHWYSWNILGPFCDPQYHPKFSPQKLIFLYRKYFFNSKLICLAKYNNHWISANRILACKNSTKYAYNNINQALTHKGNIRIDWKFRSELVLWMYWNISQKNMLRSRNEHLSIVYMSLVITLTQFNTTTKGILQRPLTSWLTSSCGDESCVS